MELNGRDNDTAYKQRIAVNAKLSGKFPSEMPDTKTPNFKPVAGSPVAAMASAGARVLSKAK